LIDLDSLLDASLLEMAARIEDRSVSPVDLVEAALARIRRLDPILHCFVTVTPEVARAQAREAEHELRRGRRRGTLQGIPFGLKDNIDTRGIPTTWGARPYRDRIADRDATVYTRLREAGAVLMGKLSLTELAMGSTSAHASVSGACRNPWDPSRWAGGSSSGPASAVAAGLVAFALGTDTMGSLLNPAAFCGTSAFRPTYGVLSRFGVLPFVFTLDKVGPMSRTSRDCTTVLQALVGRDILDPSTVRSPPAFSRVDPRSAVGLRALAVDLPPDFPVIPEIRTAYQDALRALESAGVKLTHGSNLPDLPWMQVANVIIAAESEVAFEELIRSGRTGELDDPVRRGRPWSHLEGRPSDYVKAMAIRAEMERVMAEFMEGYDLIVHPNTPVLAPAVDQLLPDEGGDLMRYAGNLVGMPAAAVPMGYVGPHRLPVGIALVGRAREDETVLSAASLFQSVTRWHLERPALTR
jgi:aspartyl-tRNA(Asn)/glutamyl-tRNA(Gln) amidotransferase subunit A